MNFISIVGTEGSGHHMMSACIQFEGCTSPRDGSLENAMQLYNVNLTDSKGIERAIKARQDSGFKYFLDNASFPWGRPYRLISRHDLILYHQLISQREDCKIFFIVLYRDIRHSTLSTFRRFDKNVISLAHSAQNQEANLLYINSQLQTIPKEDYVIVDYYDVCENPKSFESLVIERSGYKDFKFIGKNAKISKNRNTYDDNVLLNKFFSDQRMSQFRFITDNIIKL